MTTPQMGSGDVDKKKLVANRTDFLTVYFASFLTAAALLIHAMAQNDSITASVLVFPAIVSAFISAVPPLVAMIIPAGRRAVQILFGMALLPVVGACAVYVNTIIPMVFR